MRATTATAPGTTNHTEAITAANHQETPDQPYWPTSPPSSSVSTATKTATISPATTTSAYGRSEARVRT